MRVIELKKELKKYPDANVRFRLPDGQWLPAHAHVTEVARIDKRFLDCGGTLRNDSLCRLQTWFSDDLEHRLTAGKLAKILDKADPILQSDDLDVDVEHEVSFITQFPLIPSKCRRTKSLSGWWNGTPRAWRQINASQPRCRQS